MSPAARSAAAAVALGLAAAVLTVAAETTPRFLALGPASGRPANWVTGNGVLVVSGAAATLHVETAGQRSRRELPPGTVVRDAALAGPSTLFVALENGTLGLLDPLDPHAPLLPLALDPPLRAPARLAVAGDRLLIAEDGLGVRVLRMRAGHAGHGSPAAVRLQAERLLSRPVRFTAVAGAAGRIYATTDEGELLVGDALGWIRRLGLGVDVFDLDAGGDELFLLGADGLRTLDLAAADAPLRRGPYREVQGHALARSGRLLQVATAEGIHAYRDGSTRGLVHAVTVASNFFDPAELTLDVGDTVQWSNATLEDHNVVSCTPIELGCGGETATEPFSSGPATGFFFYTYRFLQAGSNPYVCQPHWTVMTGLVRVSAPPVGPPGVSDGAAGSPMTASRLDPAGDSLSISWDTAVCTGAGDYQILYGGGSQWPASPGGSYGLSGAVCAIGTTSPFTWNDSPDPTADPSRLLWWLVVTTDGADVEGPWGADGDGTQRGSSNPDGNSAECGITSRDLSNACGQ